MNSCTRGDRQADARGLHHRLHAGVDQEVFVELLHAVEAVLVHDVSDQRVALALAQLVEDRLRHALPGLRLEARLDRFLQVAGDLEALLGRGGGADDAGPLQQRGDRHTEALDDLQRFPQPLQGLLARAEGGAVGSREQGLGGGFDRRFVAARELGDERIDLLVAVCPRSVVSLASKMPIRSSVPPARSRLRRA